MFFDNEYMCEGVHGVVYIVSLGQKSLSGITTQELFISLSETESLSFSYWDGDLPDKLSWAAVEAQFGPHACIFEHFTCPPLPHQLNDRLQIVTFINKKY